MKKFLIAIVIFNIGCSSQSKPPGKPSAANEATVQLTPVDGTKTVLQQQSTVKEVLGTEKVDSLIKDVISKTSKSVSSSFILTAEALRQLRASGAPEAAVDRLSTMRDQRVEGKEQFEAAVKSRVGYGMWEKGFKNYDLERLASTSLVVKDDFVKQVESLILDSRAPTKSDPKEWLEKSFRRFLEGYIVYTEATSKDKNVIVLRTDGLDKYLKEQAAKCGELSCPGTPPCCGDECDPCKP
jgi:hypothetical protein